jgi:hypothetical protein
LTALSCLRWLPSSPSLTVSRRAYCSNLCQSQETSSPSMSSASSAFSSPHLGYAAGGDVPALVPSALGSALTNYRRHDPYSLSSSASSTSCSLLTDQDEGNDVLGVEAESHDGPDSVYETGAKSSGYLHASGLSYARRPSGTNNRSTVPLLHRRTSSSSDAAKHVHGAPQSAPIQSHTPSVHVFAQDDESDCSDIPVPPNRPRRSDHHKTRGKDSTITTTKSKRHRNRASLPAYFSLLQMSGSSNSSPRVPTPHLTPPTPKLSLAVGLPSPHAPIQITPRGRRREAGTSLASRHTRSRSRSRSRSSSLLKVQNTGIKQAVDLAYAPTRGRTTRRNSSPPQKMISNAIYGSGPDSRRGRVELGELGCSTPGLRNGRSRVRTREPIGSCGVIGWP